MGTWMENAVDRLLEAFPPPSYELSWKDVTAGLVLALDPPTMLRKGARHTGPTSRANHKPRLHLCIGVNEEVSYWMPLYGTPGTDYRRVRLGMNRYGHPKWMSSTFYVHPAQIWAVMDVRTLKAAAFAARDTSRPMKRNVLRLPSVTEVLEEVSESLATYTDDRRYALAAMRQLVRWCLAWAKRAREFQWEEK